MDQKQHKPLSRSYKPLTGFKPLTGPGDSAVRPSVRKREELRKKKEALNANLRSMKIFALSGWFILVTALFVVGVAQPQAKTYYHRQHGLEVRNTWDYELVPIIMGLCFLAFIISMAGLFINLTKSHPKGDFVHVNFIILSIASFISMCLCLIYLL